MKAKDHAHLKALAESGQFYACPKTGRIYTCRGHSGRPSEPEFWKLCTFVSQGNRSGPRNRLWFNGRRLYAARVVWWLHNGPIEPGVQVDHDNGDTLNDALWNLGLLDCYGNTLKEVQRGRTHWFKPKEHYMQQANSHMIGGDHYRKFSPDFQHWDLMELYGIGYLESAATKYVERHRHKDGKPGLEKALHYTQKLLEMHDKHGRNSRGNVPLEALDAYVNARDMTPVEAQIFGILTGCWTREGLAYCVELLEDMVQNYG